MPRRESGDLGREFSGNRYGSKALKKVAETQAELCETFLSCADARAISILLRKELKTHCTYALISCTVVNDTVKRFHHGANLYFTLISAVCAGTKISLWNHDRIKEETVGCCNLILAGDPAAGNSPVYEQSVEFFLLKNYDLFGSPTPSRALPRRK